MCNQPASSRKCCGYCIAAKHPGFKQTEKTCAWCTATDEAKFAAKGKNSALYGKCLTDLCNDCAMAFADCVCEQCYRVGQDDSGICDDCAVQ
jgi:hypothetical protein